MKKAKLCLLCMALLCMGCVVGLTACGAEKNPSADVGDTSTSTENATELERITDTETAELDETVEETETLATTEQQTESATEPTTEPVTDPVTETTEPETEPVTEPETEPETEKPTNLVMAHDQMKEELVIYDMDAYSEGMTLDDLEVWSLPVGHSAGLKYRTNSVFGDVIVVAGVHSAIYSYPTGEELWGTDIPGENPHSVELLPSGNFIVASSDDNTLRMFFTSAILEGKVGTANRYKDYTLTDAHGVLWDPEREVLWALGGRELKAYRTEGEGKREVLVEIPEMVYPLPDNRPGGHDLSPDYTDSRYLYITVGSCALRFDKETGQFSEEIRFADSLNRANIKGFSNNLFGHYFASGETGGAGTDWTDWWKAPWCTDSIYYAYSDGSDTFRILRLTSSTRAFYKIRAFCGRYQ